MHSAALTSPGGDGNHPWPHGLVAALNRMLPTRFVLAELTPTELAAAEETVPQASQLSREVMAQRSDMATAIRGNKARYELSLRPDLSMQLYTNGLLPIGLLDAIVTDTFLANVVEADLPGFEWDPGHLAQSLANEHELVLSASRIYVPSNDLAADASERFGLGDAVVAVGVGPVIEPSKESSAAAGRRILFIGNDAERKGLDLVLGAFALVRQQYEDAELNLVGREAAGVGEGVRCLGHIDSRTPAGRSRMSSILGSANLLVLPTRFDPVGFACLDAMAHGVAIVGPRSGMLAQFVVDGVTGYHCELSVESVAAAIVKCLSDTERCSWMGRRARDRQQALFTWDAAASRLYEDWTNSSRPK